MWHGLSRGAELVSDAGGRVAIALELVENARLHVPGKGALEVRVRPAPGLEHGPRLFLPLPIEADARFRLVLPDASARLYQPLRVRVVDAHGAPCAGVPVRWSAESVEKPEERVNSGGAGTTGADGRAELSLLSLRYLRWNEERFGGTHRVRTEIALALAEPVAADLGTDPTLHGEIVLVLPDIGSLRVRARRADGTEVVDGATARAWGRPRGTDENGEPIGSAAFAAGTAEIGLVGLGLTLRVNVTPDDHSCAPGRIELIGPTRAGERVDAAVTLGAERTRLVFRAVDELGAPLSGAELSGELQVERAGRTRSGPTFRDVEAGGDGRVFVWLDALDPELVPVALRVQARFERRLPGAEGADRVVGAHQLEELGEAHGGTHLVVEARGDGEGALAQRRVGGEQRRLGKAALEMHQDLGRARHHGVAVHEGGRLGLPGEALHARRVGSGHQRDALVGHALQIERPARLLVVVRGRELVERDAGHGWPPLI
jgi:hypothetical protein